MTFDLLMEAVLKYGIPGGLSLWLVYQLVKNNRSLGKVIEKKDDQYVATVETHAKEQAKNTAMVTEALTNNTKALTDHGTTMEKLVDKIDHMRAVAPRRRDT